MPLFNVEVSLLPDGSKGLCASADIRKGDIVWREPRDGEGLEAQSFPRPLAYIEALPEAQQRLFRHYMYQTGTDMYESCAEYNDLPLDEWGGVEIDDISMFMNHSCDPTVVYAWTADDFVQVATRDLPVGSQTHFLVFAEFCRLCGVRAVLDHTITPRLIFRQTNHVWTPD